MNIRTSLLTPALSSVTSIAFAAPATPATKETTVTLASTSKQDFDPADDANEAADMPVRHHHKKHPTKHKAILGKVDAVAFLPSKEHVTDVRVG